MDAALVIAVLITLTGCRGDERSSSSAVAPPKPAPTSVPASSALGALDFTVTGSPECQSKFREGMLALHSFLYDQAHETFTAALATGDCPMASWGDAMTYDHAIWEEQDGTKARAALAKVTREDGLTPKERAYLAAARALYGKATAKEGRVAWLELAAAMHRDYPDDDEVILQHVLALISVYGYDPKHVREQNEAGALALGVLQRRPEHPGAAHYIIHAFDSRDRAILALPAARTYARIAPAAGHAQHMPSHTFAHLGMWREVVPSNERATAAGMAWAKSHGESPTSYDWHSYSWLVAALLELGQYARAQKLVEDARALLVAATDDSAGLRYDYANMVAMYVTQTDHWSELDALVAPLLAPAFAEGTGGHGPVACAMHAPGGTANVRMPTALFGRMMANVVRAEAAVKAGDAAAVEQRVADLRAIRAQLAPWATVLAPDFAPSWDATQDALIARASKDPARGTAALEAAIRREDVHQSVGPGWLKTAREHLGERLLAAGNAKWALVEFERDLDARPNRAVALLGAARAATAAGNPARARAHYATLVDVWRDADPTLAALVEARAGAK